MTQLLAGKDLKTKEAQSLTASIFSTNGCEHFIKSSLLLLRKKGETIDELESFVRFLRQLSLSVKVDLPYLTDFCGTGGDGKRTFNISTLASLVAAGAGAYVVKHGNRSVSSHCGSSDLMEKLGVRLNITPDRAVNILHQTHFVYLHAPFFHPAFKQVQPVRKKLKTKTIFNFLGPLLNPANVEHQIIGVSEKSLLDVYPVLLQRLGTMHAWIVMNEDGYDEISLTGMTHAVQFRKNKIERLILEPSDFGLKKINPKELTTSSLQENVDIAKRILGGREAGPRKNVVLANAALGLVASGRALDLEEGMALARYSLETKRAKYVLEKTIELSQ
ncbi:MAG: anthranilate phosphoribosyltransferase [Candidatus Omnitrophica bacterium]|nr:anthranilate phosphoribosyltransferase [Candidatus Omnitrophota bacterium]